MLHIPASHIIVDHTNLQPLARLVDQGIGQQTTQGVVGKDIHIDMDVLSGLVDSSEQGREELITIGIDFYLIILERQ